MTAATFEFPAFEPHMKAPMAISAALHLLFVIIAIVGLPYLKPELPVIDTSITVELVDASDLNDIHKPLPEPVKPTPQEKKAEEPPKPVMPKVTAEKPPKPVAPKPPAEEMALPDKTEPVKKEPEKVKTPPKPVQRPTLTKEVEEEQPDKFNAVLKNLIGAEQEVKTEEQGKAETSPLAQMNMGEMGKLKAQLTQCWRVMAGARYAENLVVDLKIMVAPDRRVLNVEIEDKMRYNADTFFRAAADSARSAVFRCSPLDLPPNKYDQWKTIIVSFDPRTML